MHVPMRAVDVIAPLRSADALIRELHRVGTVHLAPFDAPGGLGQAVFAPSPPSPGAARVGAWLDTVTELAAVLGTWPPDATAIEALWPASDERLAAEASAAGALRGEAAALTGERLRLVAARDRFTAYRRIVGGLQGFFEHLPSLRGYGSTAIVLDVRYRSVVPLVRDELEAVTRGRCEVVAADLPPGHIAALLIYPARDVVAVRSLLGRRDIEDVTLPESLAGVPFDELLPRLDEEIARIEAEIRRADEALATLAARHGPRVEALRLVLADRAAEAQALRDATVSDHLVVVSGWIPEERLDGLRTALTAALGPVVEVVERSDAPGAVEARAPVSLANGRLVRAFEPLASFVTLPAYGTIDPTPLLALTFPAFVGMMVGDVGYGLVLAVLLLLARWRCRDTAAMAVLWPVGMLAAVSTVAFGVLYGEWFGDAGHRLLGIQPIWLDRVEAMIPLLVITVSIGAVQVALGLLLGVANAVLLRHGREAVGRAALLVGLLAVFVLVGAVARVVPAEAAAVAVAAILVAVAVSAVSVGMAGPVEMVGVVGNVLSYARLMAIGLASVMLAVVANRLGGLAENAVVGALVAVLLHALNIGLGFFDSSIQALRLHYVEFFGRFVESGGVAYAPFRSSVQPVVGAGTPVRRS